MLHTCIGAAQLGQDILLCLGHFALLQLLLETLSKGESRFSQIVFLVKGLLSLKHFTPIMTQIIKILRQLILAFFHYQRPCHDRLASVSLHADQWPEKLF